MSRALHRQNNAVIRRDGNMPRNEETMIRRKFLQLVALSGASALAPLEAMAKTAASGSLPKGEIAVFMVKGFSCPTCSVGLDTMFSRTKGIVASHSTYPEGKVIVEFDPESIHDAAVRAVITDAGFTISSEHVA
jgi:copper chaperone CopZ